MKLLVAGGAGFIGSVVSALLVESGHEVVVLDNLSHGHADAVPRGVTFVEGSVYDSANFISEKDGYDGVVNLAAFIAAGESVTVPEKYWENNLVGSLRLLGAVRAARIPRFVFSSTAMVYGDINPMPLTEESFISPSNPYATSKYAFDMALQAESTAYGVSTVSLRYFNAAGAYKNFGERHEPETHLIPMAMQAATGKIDKLSLFGDDYPTSDGTCVRDYIHVEDLANAHILALENMKPGSHAVYNLGTGTGTTNRQVIDAVERVTGVSIRVENAPRRPGDTIELVAASSKAQRELGWKPTKPDINEIVADAWQFHSQYGS